MILFLKTFLVLTGVKAVRIFFESGLETVYLTNMGKDPPGYNSGGYKS